MPLQEFRAESSGGNPELKLDKYKHKYTNTNIYEHKYDMNDQPKTQKTDEEKNKR